MTERHATSRKVTPVLVQRKLNAAVASESLQHLGLDQRHLTVDVMA
jgi:hypothetical protein